MSSAPSTLGTSSSTLLSDQALDKYERILAKYDWRASYPPRGYQPGIGRGSKLIVTTAELRVGVGVEEGRTHRNGSPAQGGGEEEVLPFLDTLEALEEQRQRSTTRRRPREREEEVSHALKRGREEKHQDGRLWISDGGARKVSEGKPEDVPLGWTAMSSEASRLPLPSSSSSSSSSLSSPGKVVLSAAEVDSVLCTTASPMLSVHNPTSQLTTRDARAEAGDAAEGHLFDDERGITMRDVVRARQHAAEKNLVDLLGMGSPEEQTTWITHSRAYRESGQRRKALATLVEGCRRTGHKGIAIWQERLSYYPLLKIPFMARTPRTRTTTAGPTVEDALTWLRYPTEEHHHHSHPHDEADEAAAAAAEEKEEEEEEEIDIVGNTARRKVLEEAVAAYPSASHLWVLLLEVVLPQEKLERTQKAILACPTAEPLWWLLLSQVPTVEDQKKLLLRALQRSPQLPSLWGRLARLEGSTKARKVFQAAGQRYPSLALAVEAAKFSEWEGLQWVCQGGGDAATLQTSLSVISTPALTSLDAALYVLFSATPSSLSTVKVPHRSPWWPWGSTAVAALRQTKTEVQRIVLAAAQAYFQHSLPSSRETWLTMAVQVAMEPRDALGLPAEGRGRGGGGRPSANDSLPFSAHEARTSWRKLLASYWKHKKRRHVETYGWTASYLLAYYVWPEWSEWSRLSALDVPSPSSSSAPPRATHRSSAPPLPSSSSSFHQEETNAPTTAHPQDGGSGGGGGGGSGRGAPTTATKAPYMPLYHRLHALLYPSSSSSSSWLQDIVSMFPSSVFSPRPLRPSTTGEGGGLLFADPTTTPPLDAPPQEGEEEEGMERWRSLPVPLLSSLFGCWWILMEQYQLLSQRLRRIENDDEGGGDTGKGRAEEGGPYSLPEASPQVMLLLEEMCRRAGGPSSSSSSTPSLWCATPLLMAWHQAIQQCCHRMNVEAKEENDDAMRREGRADSQDASLAWGTVERASPSLSGHPTPSSPGASLTPLLVTQSSSLLPPVCPTTARNVWWCRAADVLTRFHLPLHAASSTVPMHSTLSDSKPLLPLPCTAIPPPPPPPPPPMMMTTTTTPSAASEWPQVGQERSDTVYLSCTQLESLLLLFLVDAQDTFERACASFAVVTPSTAMHASSSVESTKNKNKKEEEEEEEENNQKEAWGVPPHRTPDVVSSRDGRPLQGCEEEFPPWVASSSVTWLSPRMLHLMANVWIQGSPSLDDPHTAAHLLLHAGCVAHCMPYLWWASASSSSFSSFSFSSSSSFSCEAETMALLPVPEQREKENERAAERSLPEGRWLAAGYEAMIQYVVGLAEVLAMREVHCPRMRWGGEPMGGRSSSSIVPSRMASWTAAAVLSMATALPPPRASLASAARSMAWVKRVIHTRAMVGYPTFPHRSASTHRLSPPPWLASPIANDGAPAVPAVGMEDVPFAPTRKKEEEKEEEEEEEEKKNDDAKEENARRVLRQLFLDALRACPQCATLWCMRLEAEGLWAEKRLHALTHAASPSPFWRAMKGEHRHEEATSCFPSSSAHGPHRTSNPRRSTTSVDDERLAWSAALQHEQQRLRALCRLALHHSHCRAEVQVWVFCAVRVESALFANASAARTLLVEAAQVCAGGSLGQMVAAHRRRLPMANTTGRDTAGRGGGNRARGRPLVSPPAAATAAAWSSCSPEMCMHILLALGKAEVERRHTGPAAAQEGIDELLHALPKVVGGALVLPDPDGLLALARGRPPHPPATPRSPSTAWEEGGAPPIEEAAAVAAARGMVDLARAARDALGTLLALSVEWAPLSSRGKAAYHALAYWPAPHPPLLLLAVAKVYHHAGLATRPPETTATDAIAPSPPLCVKAVRQLLQSMANSRGRCGDGMALLWEWCSHPAYAGVVRGLIQEVTRYYLLLGTPLDGKNGSTTTVAMLPTLPTEGTRARETGRSLVGRESGRAGIHEEGAAAGGGGGGPPTTHPHAVSGEKEKVQDNSLCSTSLFSEADIRWLVYGVTAYFQRADRFPSRSTFPARPPPMAPTTGAPEENRGRDERGNEGGGEGGGGGGVVVKTEPEAEEEERSNPSWSMTDRQTTSTTLPSSAGVRRKYQKTSAEKETHGNAVAHAPPHLTRETTTFCGEDEFRLPHVPHSGPLWIRVAEMEDPSNVTLYGYRDSIEEMLRKVRQLMREKLSRDG